MIPAHQFVGCTRWPKCRPSSSPGRPRATTPGSTVWRVESMKTSNWASSPAIWTPTSRSHSATSGATCSSVAARSSRCAAAADRPSGRFRVSRARGDLGQVLPLIRRRRSITDVFAMIMRVEDFHARWRRHEVGHENARAVSRLLERHAGRGTGSRTMTRFEPIQGGYMHARGRRRPSPRSSMEEAGQGVAAGLPAHGRRRPVPPMAATCSTTPRSPSRFRVIAFDMPYHGRSNPPANWWLKQIRAFGGALSWEPYAASTRRALNSSVRCCSAAPWPEASVMLQLAVDFRSELRGVIGLQSVANAHRPLTNEFFCIIPPSTAANSRRATHAASTRP